MCVCVRVQAAAVQPHADCGRGERQEAGRTNTLLFRLVLLLCTCSHCVVPGTTCIVHYIPSSTGICTTGTTKYKYVLVHSTMERRIVLCTYVHVHRCMVPDSTMWCGGIPEFLHRCMYGQPHGSDTEESLDMNLLQRHRTELHVRVRTYCAGARARAGEARRRSQPAGKGGRASHLNY